jgi:hypothetical protein
VLEKAADKFLSNHASPAASTSAPIISINSSSLSPRPYDSGFSSRHQSNSNDNNSPTSEVGEYYNDIDASASAEDSNGMNAAANRRLWVLAAQVLIKSGKVELLICHTQLDYSIQTLYLLSNFFHNYSCFISIFVDFICVFNFIIFIGAMWDVSWQSAHGLTQQHLLFGAYPPSREDFQSYCNLVSQSISSGLNPMSLDQDGFSAFYYLCSRMALLHNKDYPESPRLIRIVLEGCRTLDGTMNGTSKCWNLIINLREKVNSSCFGAVRSQIVNALSNRVHTSSSSNATDMTNDYENNSNYYGQNINLKRISGSNSLMNELSNKGLFNIAVSGSDGFSSHIKNSNSRQFDQKQSVSNNHSFSPNSSPDSANGMSSSLANSLRKYRSIEWLKIVDDVKMSNRENKSNNISNLYGSTNNDKGNISKKVMQDTKSVSRSGGRYFS